MKGFKLAVLGAIVTVTMTPALAQQTYNRFITFGDSLSDPGNLYALTSGAKPAAPYFNGHFSNGITWSEIIAPPTNTFFSASVTGNVNYAFGGARTDVLGPLNNLTTTSGATFGTTYSQVNVPPGIPVQIASYFNRGGTVTGNSMVMIWGGANNFFNLFDTGATGANSSSLPGFVLPNQASILSTASSAASDIASSVNTIYAAGGRNVLVNNLPDLGITPSFNGSTTTAQAGSGASQAFNADLAQNLAAIKAAHPDLNLIQVNVYGLVNAAAANPSAFGFVNTTQACISVAACLTGSAATQNTYLFWDSVHPTEAGQQLMAAAATQYLYAGNYAVQYAPITTVSLQERQSIASGFLDRVDPVSGLQDGIFLTSNYLHGSASNPAVGGSYNWNAASGSAGGAVAINDDWKAVFGITMDTGSTSMSTAGANFLTGSLDGAAVYRAGTVFNKIETGIGISSFTNLHRTTVGPLTNTASPTSITGNVIDELGILYRSGAMTFEPRLRSGFVMSQLESFNESGIVAPISFDSRIASAFLGGGDVRVGFDLNTKATPMTAYADLGYDAYFGVTNGRINGTLANNTASSFSSATPALVSPGISVGLGLVGKVTETATVDISYNGSFGQSSTSVQRAHANFTMTTDPSTSIVPGWSR